MIKILEFGKYIGDKDTDKFENAVFTALNKRKIKRTITLASIGVLVLSG